MKKYKYSSQVDRNAVQLSYLFLLEREIESEDAIEYGIQGNRTIMQMKDSVESCDEYKFLLNKRVITKLLQTRAEDGFPAGTPSNQRTSEVRMIQTSDPDKYKPIITASSKFNKKYCEKHNISYSSYLGIKRGCYPHHSIFNRVYLLKEMLDEGFDGWVIYMDADAFVGQPSVSIPNKLHQLRVNNKSLWLHNVYSPDDPNYSWWDINDGCFAIDLGAGEVKSAVHAWWSIYKEVYSLSDYARAKKWGDLIDDQQSFWMILRELNLEKFVQLEQFQYSGLIRQVLRDDASSESSENEIESRAQTIEKEASRIYAPA